MNSPSTVDDIRAMLDAGDVIASARALDGMHAEHKDDPWHQTLRADLMRRSGDMPGALAQCLEISRRLPQWHWHRYTMTDVASHLGCTADATKALESIAESFEPGYALQMRAEGWHAMGLDKEVLGLPADQGTRVARMLIAQSAMRVSGIPAGIDLYRDSWATAQSWVELYEIAEERAAILWDGRCAPPARLELNRRGGIGDWLLWARYLPVLQAHGTEVIDRTGFDARLRPCASFAAGRGAFEGLPPAPVEEMWTDPYTLFTTMFPSQGWGPRTAWELPASAVADGIAASARKRAGNKPCWGIFWSANESPGNFALKSACLPHVLPLLGVDDVHWVVMQRGHQMKLWLEHEDHDSATNVAQPLSIDEAAALLTQLDGVVVVDSALAHIAASLGVRTWMLASRAACWRYGDYAQYSRWYPSMTLMRQPRLGDWDGAVRIACDALRAL